MLPGGEHYTEWLITAPNLPERYNNPHFDIENLVAHVWTTERTSVEITLPTTGPSAPTPRRVLLLELEEIQSDWCQELRDAELKNTPYLDPRPPNPYRYHWVDVALRMMLLLAAEKGFHGLA